MKFIVSSSLLLRELSVANSVISTKTSLPILENFLFTLSKNQLSIAASDLENAVKITCEVTSDDEGTICIPSKILLDYLKNIDHQPLTFDISTENNIEIISDKGRYKLKGEDTAHFPKEPQKNAEHKVTVPSNHLHTAIEKTIFAASQDDVRLALTGIYLEEKNGNLRFVSTDAHRLIHYDITGVNGNFDGLKIILPKKAAGVIRNFLAEDTEGESIISFNDNHFFLQQGNIELTSRLIDAKFPDYQNVIPEQTLYTLKMDKGDLLGVVARLNIFSNRSNNMVIFSINGNQVSISAQDSDFAREGREEVQAEYQGEDIQIAFNGKFLNEILRSIHQKEILIKLSAPVKPALIFPIEDEKPLNNHLILIMPLII